MSCCTRMTKAGAPCMNNRVRWHRSEMADPQSCGSHLTSEERAELDELNARFHAEFVAPMLEWEVTRFSGDPACWSWAPPAPGSTGVSLLAWQQGRCAICATTSFPLDEDHDHQTGLVRGYLCRSCNSCEGSRRGGVWDKYREQNPASICGVRERYWHPIRQEYAEPAAPYDPWKDNPLRGVL